LAPGVHWLEPSRPEPGKSVHVPDAWLAKIDPKAIIVLQEHSVVPGQKVVVLARDEDQERQAIEEMEIKHLRALPNEPEPVEAEVVPITRRRAK